MSFIIFLNYTHINYIKINYVLYLQGSLQLYIRAVHDGSVVPSFDASDPLIDNIFFEFTGLPLDMAMIQSEMGDFNHVSIEVSITVICADRFNGSDCNTLCVEETEGIVTCREVLAVSTTTPISVDPDSTTLELVAATTDILTPEAPASQSTDNTVAIAVSVSIVLVLILLLIVGVVIGAIYLSRRYQTGTISKCTI